MASKVTIPSLIGSDTQSASTNANTQKLRQRAGKDQEWTLVAENFSILQRVVDQIVKAIRRDPSASHIEIDSADILNLIVGGRNGPGQLTILSGPPSYTRIGFDGTEETEIVFTISTVSGGTVNTTAAHSFLPGDQVRIQGNSSINHLGYWEVDTVPTDTSFTLVGPPSGSGTAGTVTFLYAGGWRKTFAIGGEGFDTAPFFGNVGGQIFIGKNGSISILDTLAEEKGFIGVVEEAPKAITAAANSAGLFRMTVAAHGYETGDDVVVVGLGDYAITKIDANTFDLQGSTYGAYTLGNVYRYRGPFWGQAIAGGGTGYDDATFRTFRDGSLRMGEPNGPRLEFNGTTGQMSLTDASITIEGTSLGDDFLLTLDASTIEVENLSDGSTIILSGGYVYMENPSLTPAALALFNSTSIQLSRAGSGFWDHSFVDAGANEGFVTTWVNNFGVDCFIDGASGHAHFASLSLDTAITGYYTSSQVDTLIAFLQTQINGKSNVGHTHPISISGTSGGGVAAHFHTGTAI